MPGPSLQIRILGLLDPLIGPEGPYELRKDASHLLLLEFHRRGREVYIAAPSDLNVQEGKVSITCRRAHVLKAVPFFEFDAPSLMPASDFSLILMRKDPPVDGAYLQAVQILTLVPPPTWVCNAPEALARWNEKLMIFQFPRWIPPTIVTSDPRAIEGLAKRTGGPVVLKSLSGFQGRGTQRANLDTEEGRATVNAATNGGRTMVMAQAFLPEIYEGEKRVMILDGKPLGALKRIPPPGGFLANPDLGAPLESTHLSRREEEICADLAPFLRNNGIFFAGIDVIGEKLTEINITSPGMLWEWNDVDNATHERTIVDHFEKRIK